MFHEVTTKIKAAWSSLKHDEYQLKLSNIIDDGAYYEFLVQVQGKNIFYKIKGDEVKNNSALLECFSEKDRFSINEKLSLTQKSHHRILSTSVSERNGNNLYEIETCDNSDTYIEYLTPLEILSKHNIIDYSKEDIYLIAFEAGKMFDKKQLETSL